MNVHGWRIILQAVQVLTALAVTLYHATNDPNSLINTVPTTGLSVVSLACSCARLPYMHIPSIIITTMEVYRTYDIVSTALYYRNNEVHLSIIPSISPIVGMLISWIYFIFAIILLIVIVMDYRRIVRKFYVRNVARESIYRVDIKNANSF